MMKNILTLILVTTMLFLGSCRTGSKGTENKLSVMTEDFGKIDGKDIFLYTLKNKNGITVKITNYGGIITSISTKDKDGNFGDIVLGFDSLKPYLGEVPYFGALVGRYANRIAKGEFELDGKKYQLARNNGNNSLHGGLKGFDKVVWNGIESQDSAKAQVVLSYQSPDGEEGYPGNLRVVVTYYLTDNDELFTIIEATTDKATPVNLTNHTYFNLTGAERDILDHRLMIRATRFTPVNDELIPTGVLEPVAGTPMDFREFQTIGARIAQVKGGYDHNYILDEKTIEKTAAILLDPSTERTVEIYTTQPGIQFYSGNFLDGSLTGRNGKVYKKHFGMCLETQHFPDSPNQPSFPNTILRPGEKFKQTTMYKFGLK